MGKHEERPRGQDETGQDVRGRRKIIEAMIEDHTLLIFQCALARRRLQDILSSGDLASAIYFRELTFVHSVVSDVHSLLRSDKPWLLAVREELEGALAGEADRA